MTDVHQQIDHLKTQIDTGAEETKQYLGTLKKRVEQYDSQNKYSEAASAYLQSGIDTACASVDELKHIGTQLQQQSKAASHETIETAQQALGKVKDSLDGLQCKAREYDRKFAGGTGASVEAGIESVVNAARQRTTDAIEMANEQAVRVMELLQNVAGGAKYGATVATGEAVKTAEMVDEKLGVTPRVASAVSGVTETVKNLDKRMHVTETAVKIDSKITGGLGSKVVHKGVEMVQESIDYVTETLHHAKLVANKSQTAQAAEQRVGGVAEKASQTAEAVQDKATAAGQQVQETAGQARDTAMGMATSAKDTVMGTAGRAGEMVSERASQAKEGASQLTDQAMEQGQQMKEGAKQKGSDVVESAKEKGAQAMEKGQQAVGSAKEKGSQAMEKGQQAMGTAQEKGQQAVGSAKEKGSQAMESTKQTMGGSSSSGGGSTMESMKQKATDVGTAAKEATMGMSSGESATDERHQQQQQKETSGDEGLVHQASKSASQAVEQAKEKMADVQSRHKSIMKDTTKA